MLESPWNRRRFLKVLGTAQATASATSKAFGKQGTGVSIVVDPADAVAATRPGQWAIEHLTQALKTRGVAVMQVSKLQDASAGSVFITAAGASSDTARRILRDAKLSVAAKPEALGIVNVSHHARGVLACGHDSRGLVYALTELADLVENAPDPVAALEVVQTSVERPANEVRSNVRMFCSELEDKPWFNDRAMWPAYFNMLATHRFNRFNLAFGIGYGSTIGSEMKDAYFHFTYPFLLKVPGFQVRVPELPDEERDSNLQMLKYISEQCVARGIDFHIGLWSHGYQWKKTPNQKYTFEGLDERTHGPYSRDAVRLLLQEVPNISGITVRSHFESGVAEGSFEFWKTMYDGIATCGRQVLIEAQSKSMTREMMDILQATKQPVSMAPKYWAEHLGLPYQQADIRKYDKATAKRPTTSYTRFSHGERSFLRYGYGDLLPEDRWWTVMYRAVAGTQRLLLWGDPLFAAGYSRAFGFCGSVGAERQEPLSFKGRRGTGRAGNRCGYADEAYNPRWDWQKFEYGTRIWGRMLYNPETQPGAWRRWLQRQFGPGAMALEIALANVSRILPSICTVYSPSAANDWYWPELYLNQSMVDAEHYLSYRDSPEPRVFSNASPLDPELFLSMNQHAEELLKSKSSGKYSPVEVAQWIEDFAAAGRAALVQAETSASGRGKAAYRRAKIDIEIQAGLGEFFAAKFRSGVLFHLYEVSQERTALEAAITQYKKSAGGVGGAGECGQRRLRRRHYFWRRATITWTLVGPAAGHRQRYRRRLRDVR